MYFPMIASPSILRLPISKKEGTGFDLPIALGTEAASGLIFRKIYQNILCGELSLDGRIKPVKGGLPMAIAAKAAGYSGIIVPEENSKEASVVSGISVLPVRTLWTGSGFFQRIG